MSLGLKITKDGKHLVAIKGTKAYDLLDKTTKNNYVICDGVKIFLSK